MLGVHKACVLCVSLEAQRYLLTYRLVAYRFKLPAHFKIANFADDDPMQPGNESDGPKRPQLERKKSEAGYLDDGGKRVAPKGPSKSC